MTHFLSLSDAKRYYYHSMAPSERKTNKFCKIFRTKRQSIGIVRYVQMIFFRWTWLNRLSWYGTGTGTVDCVFLFFVQTNSIYATGGKNGILQNLGNSYREGMA